MTKIRRHYIFRGNVQGVGFRYRAYHLAASLGLTGWVKNSWDGSVELEVQGDLPSIRKLVSDLHCLNFVWIDEMEEKELPLEEESSFHVR